jgi:hypothetical protein
MKHLVTKFLFDLKCLYLAKKLIFFCKNVYLDFINKDLQFALVYDNFNK